MSELNMEEIKARLAKATPGPWRVNNYGPADKDIYIHGGLCRVDYDDVDRDLAEADAQLIANAPADIAALLAEVRRLRGINQSLRNNQLEKHREYKAEKLRLEQALSAIERAMWDNNPTLGGARKIARAALEGK